MNDTLSPAKLDQILNTRNREVIVDAESCALVADLRAIDPTLGVRFVDGPEPFFAIYQDIDKPDGGKEQHLVTTCQAYQTSFGTYTGLDQRVVERVRKVANPDYDYFGEAEAHRKQVESDKQSKRRDQLNEMGERAAHAVRKDLGVKTKAFFD